MTGRGATGVAGKTLTRLLESGKREIEELCLFASGRSAGQKRTFRGKELTVEEVHADGFKGRNLAFSCIGTDLARKLVPAVAKFCPVRQS